MSTTVFKENNFWQVKAEALAFSSYSTVGIFNAVTHTHTMHV